MFNARLLVFISLFLSSIGVAYAQTEKAPEKVLFVGNSYTYFWNLPLQVEAMAKSKGIELSALQSTAGGANLNEHWQGEKNLKTKSLIENGNFDAVILQDHSMRSINAPASLHALGKKFDELNKKVGAKTFLYLTWARVFDPYMQQTITQEYSKLAQSIDATIVPVGPAWERAKSLRPELALHDGDKTHPSPLGSYLSACVFYGALTGQSPLGLPNVLTIEKNGEKVFLNYLYRGDAIFLQKVAEEILQEFK